MSSDHPPPGISPLQPTTSASSSNSGTDKPNPPASPRLNTTRNPSMSLAESLRNAPLSPRAHRSSSILNPVAIQDILDNPPGAEHANPVFEGRDWRTVRVEEIISEDTGKPRWVNLDESVERATEVLVSSGSPNVVLLRDDSEATSVVGTFDYSDLNAYLLLVVGLAHPEEHQVARFKELAAKGREGKPIPMRDVKDLGPKEPIVPLIGAAPLTRAVEIFGSGIHRILITTEDTHEVVGVLTQLKLVEFFWRNGRHFSQIEPLFQKTMRDLDIGSHSVISINGDKPLTEALEIIYSQGITSLPILDSHRNVVGNISHVDVRLLTKSSASTLLRGTCLQFISVILNERGIEDGKDAYPVFHVNPFSTLAHTVAKLVATLDSPSPASSGPPTPAIVPATPVTQPSATPFLPAAAPLTPGPSASSIASTNMSGRLTGVVSLTDILNLFARASGLHPLDPARVRKARRRSSSTSVRRSMESSRSESVNSGAGQGDLSRRGSSDTLPRRPPRWTGTALSLHNFLRLSGNTNISTCEHCALRCTHSTAYRIKLAQTASPQPTPRCAICVNKCPHDPVARSARLLVDSLPQSVLGGCAGNLIDGTVLGAGTREGSLLDGDRWQSAEDGIFWKSSEILFELDLVLARRFWLWNSFGGMSTQRGASNFAGGTGAPKNHIQYLQINISCTWGVISERRGMGEVSFQSFINNTMLDERLARVAIWAS
ncbi:hypothetical protein BT63DRAFT_459517 [Microthyrium microscopicum]|uniref:CBS domain-containing protein n=1 Tax=Microthyrium microscopicum TaxID=703497 RepID=A0A6A6TYX4_9PEZI|nr:hypothetical protein BT63DRAFT_459517 [Microthyrium microscopicum]